MAFSGLNVVCAFAGSYRREKTQAIIGKLNWSEAPASGAATTNAAPPVNDVLGQAIFRIRTSADAYVSIGQTPNAANSPRLLVPANTDYDVFVDGGDKLAWVAA
ncbi:hypothetical protein [Oryzifoliimicrobium ureilyticus]|uniref:hypothetical protein n=1 Tax=Oryzifoliimicrobium ureilyticus TaxID=3113724 RepID=UPI0030767459